MRVDPDTVRRLAELAELELGAEEVAVMCRDLEKVLGYVARLDELDTGEIPPTVSGLDLETPLREDRVARVLPVEEALRNAPEHDEHAMVVPKVME